MKFQFLFFIFIFQKKNYINSNNINNIQQPLIAIRSIQHNPIQKQQILHLAFNPYHRRAIQLQITTYNTTIRDKAKIHNAHDCNRLMCFYIANAWVFYTRQNQFLQIVTHNELSVHHKYSLSAANLQICRFFEAIVLLWGADSTDCHNLQNIFIPTIIFLMHH